MKYFLIIINIIIFSNASAFESVLSENAPEDKPYKATSSEELDKFHKAIEPYVQQAKVSYPEAKKRYSSGLPIGENFFITTRLYDHTGSEEQVFILVNKITGGIISGIIYNEIQVVVGYKNGQKYDFPETEVYDWLITKPDGSEEGNFVGKFLDTYR